MEIGVTDPKPPADMDEEFLTAFDIFLDKDGKSELIYDFPGEDWGIVWSRESKCIQDFIDESKMIVWSIQEGTFEGELVEAKQELVDAYELAVIGDKLIFLSASELIQCLLYPDLDMEIIADVPLEKGTYLFEKIESIIQYNKK